MQGYEWRVRLAGNADKAHGAAGQAPGHDADRLDSEALVRALALADRPQRENLELAGRCGYLQARLEAAD
jgi:hypothetical protein